MANAVRINIAIASPGDVSEEREAVGKVFTRWNSAHEEVIIHPLMWESASVPALGDHPQTILNKQIIRRSELLVAIFWSRLGTPTPTAPSGTVEEIEEFILEKGPGRVMLYFCKRSLPNDIDPAELVRLREFKSRMRSKGLFAEYLGVHEFEIDLYSHLDRKVQQFLDGELPLPAKSEAAKTSVPRRADHRLHETIDFGTSLSAISNGFTARMEEFLRVPGGGPDKFLDLASHVYTSCAECLDRFLSYSASTLKYQDRERIEKISNRLKRLAARSDEYLKMPFEQYFTDGRDIANDLDAQFKHLSRIGRS